MSRIKPVAFVVHPRTRALLESNDPERPLGSVMLLEPLGYLDFLALEAAARRVDRFRWYPGGDHGARRALPDVAR